MFGYSVWDDCTQVYHRPDIIFCIVLSAYVIAWINCINPCTGTNMVFVTVNDIKYKHSSATVDNLLHASTLVWFDI